MSKKLEVERGMPFATIKKKFTTIGEMCAYYKKHGIDKRYVAKKILKIKRLETKSRC